MQFTFACAHVARPEEACRVQTRKWAPVSQLYPLGYVLTVDVGELMRCLLLVFSKEESNSKSRAATNVQLSMPVAFWFLFIEV